jgi:hypothetical protein
MVILGIEASSLCIRGEGTKASMCEDKFAVDRRRARARALRADRIGDSRLVTISRVSLCDDSFFCYDFSQ